MAVRSVATTQTLDNFRTTFNSLGTDVGDLTVGGDFGSTSSSTTHGYHTGGRNGGSVMEKFSFSSDGNATSIGSLSSSKTKLVAGSQE